MSKEKPTVQSYLVSVLSQLWLQQAYTKLTPSLQCLGIQLILPRRSNCLEKTTLKNHKVLQVRKTLPQCAII